MIRNIVTIDEEKCNGCGLCVPACHEGAIRIINGKAKLTADNLCDGLGACLGHCPQGAIRVEKREAADFNEQAVADHLHSIQKTPQAHATNEIDTGSNTSKVAVGHDGVGHHHDHGGHHPGRHGGGHSCGCPSTQFIQLDAPSAGGSVMGEAGGHCSAAGMGGSAGSASALAQWPVQLHLLPPKAPVFQGADLLLTADCVPFAMADFHHLLGDHALAIACPKLDDTTSYVPKLTEIVATNSLRSLTVVRMQLPCCAGLTKMALQAWAAAGAHLPGVELPLYEIIISTRGELLERRTLNGPAGQ